MEIQSESYISHPQQKVYEAYRNHLSDIARYMPDIREIVRHKCDETDAGVSIHNEWISSTSVPLFLRAILKPEHLRWNDYADWNDAGHYVDWRIRTNAFTDAVTCAGRNTFHASGSGTRVVLTGNLDIDLTKIRGVRRFGAGRLKPKIEKFIVGMITPNLKKVNMSLQTYLDDQG